MLRIICRLLITGALLIGVCSTGLASDAGIIQSSDTGKQPALIWEVAGLNNPESVVYSKADDVLFVSNVNGAPNDKDGNGYISKIRLDGSISDQYWLTGLNAPKGLAIHNDMLYVADIDTLVAIDILSATVSERYQVSDAQFLNDVASTAEGEIFVSDMFQNRIHRLADGKFAIWLETAVLENPNGLHVDRNHLILGAWGVIEDGFSTPVPGHLKSISLLDKSVTSLGGAPVGNLDGVEPSATKDHYYVTDWIAGRLFSINTNGETELLLELEPGMADLEVLPKKRLILLPMMNSNKLLAYRL